MLSIPQTEYGLTDQLIPRYKYVKFAPTNVSQAIFNPSNTNLVTIRLPALNTINLAKSFLQYSFTIPAGGANNWTVVAETGCDFTSVQLQPSTALNLVDLNFANKYVHLIAPYRKKLEVDHLAGACDIMSKNRPSLQPAQNNIQIASSDGLTTLPGVYASAAPYFDRQYLSFSSQPNTAVTVNRKIPLSAFDGTLLALNKDLYFPCDLYLQLTLSPLYNIFTYTTTPQTPGVLANQTAPAAAITCSSFQIVLAVEVNESITNSIIAEINKGGLKLPIPFTYNSLQITPSAVSQSSCSFLVPRANGRQLNKIITSVWNINQNSLLNYDCNNTQGCKISAYNSFMDGTQLQAGMQNCFNPNASYNAAIWPSFPYSYADDWTNNLDSIKGSSIVNYGMYGQSWMVADQFGVQPFEDESQQMCNQWWCSELSGLSLTTQASDHMVQLTYNCPGTCPAVVAATNSQGSCLLFTAQYSRYLEITAAGVYLSN